MAQECHGRMQHQAQHPVPTLLLDVPVLVLCLDPSPLHVSFPAEAGVVFPFPATKGTTTV